MNTKQIPCLLEESESETKSLMDLINTYITYDRNIHILYIINNPSSNALSPTQYFDLTTMCFQLKSH